MEQEKTYDRAIHDPNNPASKAAMWWFNEGAEKYRGTRYEGKSVAVVEENIIESSEDFKDLIKKVEERGLIPQKDCYLTWLPGDCCIPVIYEE